MKRIALSLAALFFSACAQGPVQKIIQKKHAGQFKDHFSLKSMGSSELISDGQSLYWGTDTGFVFRVDGQTGKKIWSTDASDAISTSGLVKDSLLFFGTQNGAIICLDKLSGKILWKEDLGRSIRGNLVFFKEVLFFIDLNNRIIGLDITQKKQVFSRAFSLDESFSLAYQLLSLIQTNDSHIVFLLPNLEMLAIDPSLKVLWSKNLSEHIEPSQLSAGVSLEALDDGQMIVTPHQAYPLILNSDGSLVSKLIPVKSQAGPLIQDTQLYFVGENYIFGVDQEDLSIQKTIKYDNGLPISKIYQKGNTLWVVKSNGSLELFDLQSQSRIWTYHTDAPTKGSVLTDDELSLWLLNQRGQLFRYGLD